MLDTILNHAKHFTDDSVTDSSRKIVKVVHYHDCGSLFMSDGFVALFALNVHNLNDCTKTVAGKVSPIEPISLERIIRLIGTVNDVNSRASITANIDVHDLLNHIQHVVNVSKLDSSSSNQHDPLLQIGTEQGKGLVIEQHGVEVNSTYVDDEVKDAANTKGAKVYAKKLVKVLNVYADLGYGDVQLLITGPEKPVELRTYDCKFRCVVLPVRPA